MTNNYFQWSINSDRLKGGHYKGCGFNGIDGEEAECQKNQGGRG